MTTMTTKTVVLKEGAAWVELVPIFDETGNDLALIVLGTFGRPGDILRKPTDLTWAEAAEELLPHRTVLSPFDLELVFDSVTEFLYLPEGGLEELFELAEERAERSEGEVLIDLLDDAEACARFIDEAMNRGADRHDTGFRRRKADAAA